MDDDKIQLYLWNDLHWGIEYDINGDPSPFALCPSQRCHCRLRKSKESYSRGEYKYFCPKCEFKITLNKSIEEKANDLIAIIESQKYRDAEIINIDGELIKVRREQAVDYDYWADVKISKNKKDEIQLMVLAGSKKDKDKTQLFIDPKNEKVSFDQNNDHPIKVFSKIIATFKNSNSEITSKNK